MRLIDADALMADFQKAFPNFDVKSSHAKALLATAPTIEADSVKHARWEFDKRWGNQCSECGFPINEIVGTRFSKSTTQYCPYCGARMDLIGEDKSHPFAESVMMGMDGGEND